MKHLTRNEMDPINDAVEIALSESKRIPVVYQGKLYYLYAADTTDVQLEDINVIQIREDGDSITFAPAALLYVPATDPAIRHFVQTCIKSDEYNCVDVRFAELNDNNMKIVLTMQDLPRSATGRFYTFVEDHYEIEGAE